MFFPPIAFTYGPVSSIYNVPDAFAPYYRSKYCPSSSVQSSGMDGFLSPQPSVLRSSDPLDPVHGPYAAIPTVGTRRHPSRAHTAHETTSLLRKAAPFTAFSSGHVPTLASHASHESLIHPDDSNTVLRGATSCSSDTIVEHRYDGKSTYAQTLFNCVGVLLGIGVLSEPLAFAYAGWFWGTALIVFFGFITCYTAKLLAHEVLDDPRLRSYADICRKAFGPKSSILINILFCLDLFSLSTVLVILAADSLEGVWPAYTASTYKVFSLCVLVPTVFMPLSALSFTSLLGISSMFLVIGVIFVDGLSKSNPPGSLWSPAPTSFSPGTLGEVGVTFGLLMAGFAGHVVVPSLVRDMKDPSQFDRLANQAFLITTFIYTVVGSAGYLMFGKSVSDEISKDLLSTPGYNSTLNQLVMWSLVVTPLSKYALSTRPLNVILESRLGLEINPFPSAEDGNSLAPGKPWNAKNRLVLALERIAIPILSISCSILVPQFCVLMAFLGSFCAFFLCVIGPISVKVAMTGRCSWYDGVLLGVSALMAVWGTLSAFWMT